jgi:hypothetical protein
LLKFELSSCDKRVAGDNLLVDHAVAVADALDNEDAGPRDEELEIVGRWVELPEPAAFLRRLGLGSVLGKMESLSEDASEPWGTVDFKDGLYSSSGAGGTTIVEVASAA